MTSIRAADPHLGAPFLDAFDGQSYAAMFDRTSGVPSRALLFDRLVMALARTQRSGTAVGLLLFRIADSFDDRAVCKALEIVDRELRADDTIGRVGPHEFVGICHLRDYQEVHVVVRRVAQVFDRIGAASSVTIRTAVGGANDAAADLLAGAERAIEMPLADAIQPNSAQVSAEVLWPKR